MFSTALGFSILAGFVAAAPVNVERDQPSTYYTPYLEPYDGYHLRYLALDCQDKHNTSFFQECCRPLVVAEGQTLGDRPSYCTPNATEIASASSYIASTSEYGAPTPTATGGDSATTTTSADADEASEYSSAEAAAPTTTQAAPTTQAAAASPKKTTSSSEAPAATQASSSSSNNNNAPSGSQTGGYATYFYQNGNPGACGNYNSDSTPLVAIDQAWWPNFGSPSQYCGKYVTIQNNNNGKTVTAVIADVCPTCANGNSLDLSVGAFTAIASESEGQVPITWWFD